jgi:ABC-2 type transport system permease protein
MTLWRLEWLRLWRTKRWLVLAGIFVFFGLIGPLTARYLRDIIDFAGGKLDGTTIEFPPPVPSDGMAQFVSNAMQLGTLVVVVVAAGALAFDAVPEIGVFLRSRVDGVRRILAPRFLVTTAAVLASFGIGVLAAWYETWVLIGSLDAAAAVVGFIYGSVFLVFVVALVAAVAGWAKSVMNTVLISVVALLLMPIAGTVGAIGTWLPTHLAGSLGPLTAGDARSSDYFGVVALTLALTVLMLWAAVFLADRRET